MTTKSTSACAARIQLEEGGQFEDAIAILQHPYTHDVAVFLLCDKLELGPIQKVHHYDIFPGSGCITFQFASDPVGDALLSSDSSCVNG